MRRTDPQDIHRRRQGLILLLLLLGPSPISLLLFLLGNGAAAVRFVLLSTALLIGLVLELYRRQRRDAKKANLKVLPKAQVLAMLAMIGFISAGVFMLPTTGLQGYGFAAVSLAISIIYIFGAQLRPTLTDPDERSAVLILGLMASLIALGNGFV